MVLVVSYSVVELATVYKGCPDTPTAPSANQEEDCHCRARRPLSSASPSRVAFIIGLLQLKEKRRKVRTCQHFFITHALTQCSFMRRKPGQRSCPLDCQLLFNSFPGLLCSAHLCSGWWLLFHLLLNLRYACILSKMRCYHSVSLVWPKVTSHQDNKKLNILQKSYIKLCDYGSES